MPGVRIVCDSTADLEPGYAAAHGVAVVPLKVIFGEDVLADGVDITPAAFYERMRTSGVQPRTSQPTPAEFQAAFAALDGAPALCTTISAELSGTFTAARQAREALPDAEITVLDTRSAAVGHNAVVHAAVAAAEAGASAEAVTAAARRVMETQQMLFTVETLEFLRRGGRIGAARALVGSVLDIKPILALRDGVIEPVERVRTYGRALQRLLDVAEERLQTWGGGVVTLGHADRAETAEQLAELLQGAPGAEVRVVEVGPVIGCHSGPGGIGLSVHPTL